MFRYSVSFDRLVADYKTFFAKMSVDAITMLGDDLSVSSVGIKKVTGGSVTDTMLVEGVCFKKCVAAVKSLNLKHLKTS